MQPPKGHEKCIFETLHNEIRCVVSINESNEKRDQNVHISLRSGQRGLTPPPPHGEPKISVFFDFPKQCFAISSPFSSVLFATFLAFSTGGKFLRPSQTPGGEILFLFFFLQKIFWHLRLVLTVREPSAWYKSVATTLLPLVRQIDRYPCVYVTLLLCVFVF